MAMRSEKQKEKRKWSLILRLTFLHSFFHSFVTRVILAVIYFYLWICLLRCSRWFYFTNCIREFPEANYQRTNYARYISLDVLLFHPDGNALRTWAGAGSCPRSTHWRNTSLNLWATREKDQYWKAQIKLVHGWGDDCTLFVVFCWERSVGSCWQSYAKLASCWAKRTSRSFFSSPLRSILVS